jgi:Cdc6-like AAA superfamily ATPase
MSNKIPQHLKFLDAYEKEDYDYFFGREEDILKLYEKIKKHRLTVVYGYSGTGKTSLIQCGLSHQFSSTDWMDILIRVKRNSTINETLFEGIQMKAKSSIQPPVNGIYDSEFLLECLETLYRDYFRTVYLIFDQFEELFIQGTDEEKNQFTDFLVECLKSDVNVKIILVIREEYLGSLDEFESRIPRFYENCSRLERMSKKTIKRVIKNILKENGIEQYQVINEYNHNISQTITNESSSSPITTFTDGENEDVQDVRDIMYDIIKDSNTKTVDLPYMQVYLDKLIRNLPEDTVHLTKKDVLNTGILDDVLADFLQDRVDLISRKVLVTEDEIWDVLNILVSVDGTKQSLKSQDIKKAISILNE